MLTVTTGPRVLAVRRDLEAGSVTPEGRDLEAGSVAPEGRDLEAGSVAPVGRVPGGSIPFLVCTCLSVLYSSIGSDGTVSYR